MSHLLSLAAGVLPEFPPDRIVQAAAEAGYRATGIWCDTETWTDETTREVHRQLRNGALQALDIEVIWIRPGREVTDSARRLIEIGGELGARNVLIVSANPEPRRHEAPVRDVVRTRGGGGHARGTGIPDDRGSENVGAGGRRGNRCRPSGRWRSGRRAAPRAMRRYTCGRRLDRRGICCHTRNCATVRPR